MEYGLFVELSIIIVTALVVSSIMKILKQPVMIGYIITGIILSPQIFNIIHNSESLNAFAQIGIAFLLFTVGLHLNPRNIKETGSVSLFAGILQIMITTLIGYGAGVLLGFSQSSSIFIGIGLAFSSTIVIMKLIGEKKDLQALYGRISTGILIVQDLIAMIVLMVVSSLAKGGDLKTLLLETTIKSVIIIGILLFFSKKILPEITKKAASSQETLLLFAISWCLITACVFYFMDFSIEIGALLAGIALSMSPYRHEISSKLKSLQDFFMMIFFVTLGSHMAFNSIVQLIIPATILSLIVLIGNPIIIMSIMGMLGYTKKNSFKTGLSCAQISEFSLIVIALGIKLGQIPEELSSLMTMVGIITITGSTYFIIYSDQLFNLLGRYLNIFERKKHKIDKHIKHNGEKHEVVLLGFSKMGSEITKGLCEMKKKFLVVDFDPKNIINLTRQGIDCRYGDIGNSELFNDLNFDNVKMVISAIKDFDTNALIIHKIREINKKCIIIVMSHQIEEALFFYDKGANYVIMPNYIGGYHTSGLISELNFKIEKFNKEKTNHINQLLIRKQINFEKN